MTRKSSPERGGRGSTAAADLVIGVCRGLFHITAGIFVFVLVYGAAVLIFRRAFGIDLSIPFGWLR